MSLSRTEIRTADPRDADKLSALALRSKAHWDYSQEFMDACREELRIDSDHIQNECASYFVADLDGHIVGYYALIRESVSACELEALFVEPAHIGTGIGRLLIEHAKKTAIELGTTQITIQGDPNAERFYLAAGATRIGDRESGSIPGRYLPVFAIEISHAE